ncbi:acylphosphatase [Kordiimonas sp. SCSIO 12610]|uniref:acylphosphatase n=1 Tax=Kordiimonas sp. SCSIO 12610 TaxID=2829597 RepID=UPI00210B8597|nr:acylphosphatase [Kordiimonas sp. SCSIO 12610]UTW54287.1 acylphosphatase [Kordiimonas sp. SCSIO 12610]
MQDRIAKRLTIKGKVQGVWYRKWCEQQALGLGIDGFVRNRINGDVEALIIGTTERVDRMIDLCYTGPDNAVVSEIVIEDAQGFVPARFEIKPTV